MLTKFVISGSFFSRFLSFFQHLKVIKFFSLKQQQIYGSVILSRSRTSAILAQFFLIHVVCGENVQFSGKDKLTSRNTVIFLKVHKSCFVIGMP